MPEQSLETENTANIVLLGYSYPSVSAFKTAFTDVIDDELQTLFSFEPQDITVNQDDEFLRLPESVIAQMVPIVELYDKNLKILVKYEHFEKRLLVMGNSFDQIENVKKIVTTLVNNQANRIKALGYNFESKYPRGEGNKINNDATRTLETTRIKEITASNVIFSYNEGDYKKTFKLFDEDGIFKITANYHYERFKSTRSVGNIRNYVIEEINKSFASAKDNFVEIRDEITAL